MDQVFFNGFVDELRKIAQRDVKPANKIPISEADANIYSELEKGSPVKIQISDEAGQYGGGYFDQDTNAITLTEKDFGTLAHELGHAHIQEHFLGRIIQSKAARTAFSLSGDSIAAGLGVGILMAKGKSWGLLLPAALAAPTLISEILANRKGKKLLEGVGATEEQKKRYEEASSKGTKTYLRTPLGGTLSGAMVGGLAATGAFRV